MSASKQRGKGRKKPVRKQREWRPVVLSIGAAAMSFLAALAALPYTLGDLALVIPSQWKPTVTGASITAAFILRVLGSTTTTNRP